MRLAVDSSVVSITVASELTVATSSITLAPIVLLQLHRLWYVLVLALLVLTVGGVASHVSLLSETVLVPMLLGLAHGVLCILESISQV